MSKLFSTISHGPVFQSCPPTQKLMSSSKYGQKSIKSCFGSPSSRINSCFLVLNYQLLFMIHSHCFQHAGVANIGRTFMPQEHSISPGQDDSCALQREIGVSVSSRSKCLLLGPVLKGGQGRALGALFWSTVSHTLASFLLPARPEIGFCNVKGFQHGVGYKSHAPNTTHLPVIMEIMYVDVKGYAYCTYQAASC